MKPTAERIKLLNEGVAQTKNLMEALSIDFHELFKNAMPEIVIPPFEPKTGITKKMHLVARAIHEQNGWQHIELLKVHQSDTVRAIACYLLVEQNFDLATTFQKMYPLADDMHFGVREWAWMAVRPHVIKNPGAAIEVLKVWAQDQSERVRRFASEISRPRGVWCAHIKELREKPWLALDILELLKNDESRYVQLSVGNWLNDASKDQPEWVIELCERWLIQSESDNTKKICKRALRTVKKKSL